MSPTRDGIRSESDTLGDAEFAHHQGEGGLVQSKGEYDEAKVKALTEQGARTMAEMGRIRAGTPARAENLASAFVFRVVF